MLKERKLVGGTASTLFGALSNTTLLLASDRFAEKSRLCRMAKKEIVMRSQITAIS
jgi:hypothetical protein